MFVLVVEFSFPLVRTFPIMLFMHVSFMMPWIVMVPWIIMMIVCIAMTVVWVYSMMIVMRIVFTLEEFWSKSVMDEIVWVLFLVMLPFIMMAIMMKIVIILKMVISMVSVVVSMFSMVETMQIVLEMEVFILLIEVGKMMTIMSVTVSKSMPLIVSPMSMTVVVRMCWIVDWLSFFWYPVNISVTMMIVIMIVWFHFQH